MTQLQLSATRTATPGATLRATSAATACTDVAVRPSQQPAVIPAPAATGVRPRTPLQWTAIGLTAVTAITGGAEVAVIAVAPDMRWALIPVVLAAAVGAAGTAIAAAPKR